MLVVTIMREATALGCERVRAWADATNRASRALMERHRCVLIGSSSRYGLVVQP